MSVDLPAGLGHVVEAAWRFPLDEHSDPAIADGLWRSGVECWKTDSALFLGLLGF
jgi:hypothetical protein